MMFLAYYCLTNMIFEYAYIFLEDEITSITENPDQRFVALVMVWYISTKILIAFDYMLFSQKLITCYNVYVKT